LVAGRGIVPAVRLGVVADRDARVIPLVFFVAERNGKGEEIRL
jgi:hypothetical protein